MIEEISIENLGVISAAQLSFGSGMNVLTGETGAGKTMVLTSLMLLMGAKATAAKVRHGEERANITGVFRVPAASLACEIVARAGGKVDSDGKDAEIIVSRQVLASGRSRAYLGGVNVPIVTLQEIAAELFTVHGQQDQIRLASKTEHLQALDQYIGLRGMRISQEYLEKWQKCQELSRKLTQEKANVAAIAAERLALEALIKRVDAVDPKLGEDDELRAQAMRLDNIEALRSALAQSVQLLEGDEYQPGAVNMIDTAQRELSQTHDPDLESSAKTLAESTTIISQVLSDLVTALENLDADPEQLNAIHQRRADLTALTRELGMDIPTILAKREDANNRLQEITDPDTYLAQLSASLAKAEAECAEMAAKITAFRKKGAAKLAQDVSRELNRLAMKDAKFSVQLEKMAVPGKYGQDDIEFLLAPHAGAPLNKLAATASGGEMSRIMLAIEVSLAKQTAQSHHTFIFDEVDAGIGGETALSVGRRLGLFAQSTQVIVVTHLAQVAAVASTHLVVEKETAADQTETKVWKITDDEREKELARMLSGQKDSEAARTHAAELISAVSMARLDRGV